MGVELTFETCIEEDTAVHHFTPSDLSTKRGSQQHVVAPQRHCLQCLVHIFTCAFLVFFWILGTCWTTPTACDTSDDDMSYVDVQYSGTSGLPPGQDALLSCCGGFLGAVSPHQHHHVPCLFPLAGELAGNNVQPDIHVEQATFTNYSKACAVRSSLLTCRPSIGGKCASQDLTPVDCLQVQQAASPDTDEMHALSSIIKDLE